MDALEEEEGLRNLEQEQFVARIAHYYCVINMLHSFREGNGLAQRIFFEQLALHAGYFLEWQNVKAQPWREANQAGDNGDLAPLEAVFASVVSRASL